MRGNGKPEPTLNSSWPSFTVFNTTEHAVVLAGVLRTRGARRAATRHLRGRGGSSRDIRGHGSELL